MASEIIEIITKYTAEVAEYKKAVDDIISQQNKFIANQLGIKDGSVNVTKTLTAAANSRKKLLEEETKNLKSLEAGLKTAFNIPQIKVFNEQIAQSKSNIALLKGETEKTGGLFSGLKSQLAGVGAGIAAAFSVGAIISFGKQSIQAFLEAEKSAKLLETAIKNVAGGDDSAVAKFLEQSKELQKTTIFSDEQIQSAQTLAFQFGLTQKQVEELIPVIADFASATGQELQPALESVLRATQGQARALKVYGINIESTGNKAKDLIQITEQLNKKFEGQAKIVGETTAGAIERAKNQFNELEEVVGGGLINVFEGLVGTVDVLTGHLFELVPAFDANSEAVVGFGKSTLEAKKDIEAFQKTIDTFIQSQLKTKLQLLIDTGGSKEEIDNVKKSLQAFNEEEFRQLSLNKLNDTELIKLAESFQSVADSANQVTPELKAANEELKRLQQSGAAPDLIKAQQAIVDSLISVPKAIQTISSEALQQLLDDSKKEVGVVRLSSEEKLRIIKEELQKRGLAETNSLAQLKQKLQDFQKQLEDLPLTPLGKPVDPAEFKRISDEIKKLNDQINEITGKASEERTKKAKEEADKLLKIQEDNSKKLLDLKIKSAEDLAAIQVADDPIKKLDAEYDKRLQDAVRVFNLSKKSVEDRANLAETLSNIELAFERQIANETLKIKTDLANKLKDLNEKNLKEDLADTLATIDLSTSEQKLAIQKQFNEKADFTKTATDAFEKEISRIEINADIVKNKEILKSDIATNQEKINAQKKLNDDLASLYGLDVANVEDANNEKIKSFEKTFNDISGLANQLFSDIAAFQSAQISAQIDELEKLNEQQQTATDKELERLQKLNSDKLISQKDYDAQVKILQDKKLANEKKIQAEISALKKKQAEQAKALQIFEAIINTARAVAEALPNIPLSIAVGALGAVEVALILATPIPAFKKGTKGKQGSGLSLVGEEGAELVQLPHGSQVLPHPQLKKNRRFIDAMFDNNLDDLIQTDYINPALIKETTKRSLLKEQITQVVYKEKIIQIAPRLQEQQSKNEIEKQKVFAQNIAQSFSTQITNTIKTDGIDEYGMMRALAKHRKHDKAFADYLAEQIVTGLSNEDSRYK